MHEFSPIIPFRQPANTPTNADDAKTGAHLSVGDFYHTYQKPILTAGNRAIETIKEYERHVRRWHEWQIGQDNTRIQHPVLTIREIKRADLLDWRNWLLSEEGIKASNRTANRTLASIQAILETAAERGAHENPPRLKPLECRKAARKQYLTFDQIDALFDGCEAAQWPTIETGGLAPLPYSPPIYWRAFIVLQFNYGMRTQELACYERPDESLRWRQIVWETETPAVEGSAQNEHGWLYYLPTKQKRMKPDPLVLPLNATVARFIRSIEPPGGADAEQRLFPFPYCNRSFYNTWRAIVERSGVRLKIDLKTGKRANLEIKLFRKTCETWHDTHRTGMGEIMTGHAERSVSGKHYANRELRMVEAINTFPQPARFG